MQLVTEWVENPIYLDDDEDDFLEINEIKGEKPMDKVKKEKQNNMYEDFIKASQEFGAPTFNKKVKYGSTNWEYADLSEILRCVQDPLLENGFIIVHELIYKDDKSWLKTYIKYKDDTIFSESIFPLDYANKKMQDIGSQITYLKRYQLSAMCCINADLDNDAVEMKDQKLNETIDQDEIHAVNRCLNKLDAVQRSEVFRVIKTSQVNKIEKSKYPKVLNYIKDYVNEQKSKNISYEEIEKTS